MSKTHHYEALLRWTGAAQGPTTSYTSYSREYAVEIAGKSVMKGSADPGFRGDASLHNPEDLLLASLAACHMLTYLALATRSRLVVVAYEDAAVGTMLFEGASGKFTEVLLKPKVTVAAGSDLALAERLHHDANAGCFIARSVNVPIRHQPTTEVA